MLGRAGAISLMSTIARFAKDLIIGITGSFFSRLAIQMFTVGCTKSILQRTPVRFLVGAANANQAAIFVIPSEVEESLDIVWPLLRSETLRDVSTPLDMTERERAGLLLQNL